MREVQRRAVGLVVQVKAELDIRLHLSHGLGEDLEGRADGKDAKFREPECIVSQSATVLTQGSRGRGSRI